MTSSGAATVMLKMEANHREHKKQQNSNSGMRHHLQLCQGRRSIATGVFVLTKSATADEYTGLYSAP